MRCLALLAPLALALVFVAPGAAAQQVPTPVPVETDTLDNTLRGFLDPCTAIRSYLLEMGINPALSSSPAMRALLESGWAIMAAGLATLAERPELAQDAVSLRAEFRNIINSATHGQGGLGGRRGELLDDAAARWWSGDYTEREAPGLFVVALVMDDPARAAAYRGWAQYGGAGRTIRNAQAPGLPTCP